MTLKNGKLIMLLRTSLYVKFLTTALGLLCFLSAAPSAAQPALKLGDVQVLSSPQQPPLFEVGLSRNLPLDASIQLAAPALYAAAGFAYPLWLSDAVITLKQRAGQPHTLLIQAKRSPTKEQHELLLALSTGDIVQVIPYIFLTDAMAPSSTDRPMPPALTNESATQTQTQPTLADIIAKAGQAAQQENLLLNHANRTVQDSQAYSVSTDRHLKRPVAKRATRAAGAAVASPVASVSPAPQSPAVIPSPASAASEPVSAASAASPAAPTTAIPTAAVVRTAQRPASSSLTWLSDPLTLGLGAGILLLVIYLILRLWSAKRAQQAQNAPLLTRETGFQPNSLGTANTVFGLSDTEAIAMQQQWAQQKIKS